MDLKPLKSFLLETGRIVCPYAREAAEKEEIIYAAINNPKNPQKKLYPKVQSFLENRTHVPNQALICIPKEVPQSHQEAQVLAQKYFLELAIALKRQEFSASEPEVRAAVNKQIVPMLNHPHIRPELDFQQQRLDIIALSPLYKDQNHPRYAPNFFLSCVWGKAVESAPNQVRDQIRAAMAERNNGHLYDARELYIIPTHE